MVNGVSNSQNNNYLMNTALIAGGAFAGKKVYNHFKAAQAATPGLQFSQYVKNNYKSAVGSDIYNKTANLAHKAEAYAKKGAQVANAQINKFKGAKFTVKSKNILEKTINWIGAKTKPAANAIKKFITNPKVANVLTKAKPFAAVALITAGALTLVKVINNGLKNS